MKSRGSARSLAFNAEQRTSAMDPSLTLDDDEDEEAVKTPQ